MIAVRVCMKVTKEPLKRTPVVLQIDADGSETEPVLTDRTGVARFELPPASGKILVSGVERYHGRLDGEILVDLWSITEPGNDSAGMPGEFPAGSNAYPGMTTRAVRVGDREVLTDSEGYLVDPGDWSEAFARARGGAGRPRSPCRALGGDSFSPRPLRQTRNPGDGAGHDSPLPPGLGPGKGDQQLPAQAIPPRRPAETRQSVGRAAAYQGRALSRYTAQRSILARSPASGPPGSTPDSQPSQRISAHHTPRP